MKQHQQEQPKGGMLSSLQFLNALNKYIPSLVLQNWIDNYTRMMIQQDLQKRMLQKQPTNKEGKKPAIVQKPANTPLPHIQDMETVVLFADISGFTNISEACASMGIRGNEELAFCINRYMEGMVKNLVKFGGDIIKFVGDAMIVMWPRTNWNQDDVDTNEHDEKVNVIRKAIQCAMDIQKELNNKKIMANVTNLSVKIGIGFGKCALLYVGGVFDRSEFFTVGSALTYALKSEEQATSGGQIIVSETAFKHVKHQYYEGEEIISDENKKFYRVTKVITGVRGRADAVLLKSQLKFEKMQGIQKSLKSVVPAAIMPYLEIGYEQFGSETRALTVMFASLGVDLSSASSKEGLNKIQRIVTTVQQQVYRLEGSLNKLVMDDKGSTLICIWGLSPISHSDDPQRAILTAINMRRELKKIENTWCNVGIATGDVFSGVVGTSGSRKEFSVLGDTVNLAARIMFWPLKFGKHGKINCDLRTKNEAMNHLSFKYGQHCEFKGKSISIPIFEPIDPNEEFQVHEGSSSGYANKIIPPQAFLKLHYNPMIVQRQVNHRKYVDTPAKVERVGDARRLEELMGWDKTDYIQTRRNYSMKGNFDQNSNHQMVMEIYDLIKDFFFSQKISNLDKVPLNIIIEGGSGSGKTHAVRCLVEKLQKDQDFLRDQQIQTIQQKSAINASANLLKEQNHHKKAPIFASCLNCETRMNFLGAWRPILRNMLEYMRKVMDMNKMHIIRELLVDNLDKMDIILQVFGIITDLPEDVEHDYKIKTMVYKNHLKVPQVKKTNDKDPLKFLTGDVFSNFVIDDILEMMVRFIKTFLGEIDDNLFSSQDDSSLNSNLESKPNNYLKLPKKESFEKKQRPPLILIFDNSSLMDSESWALLNRVYKRCSNIAIILLTELDQKGNSILPTFNKQKYSYSSTQGEIEKPYFIHDIEIAQEFAENALVFDMTPLQMKDLRDMLLEVAPAYLESYRDEVIHMTEIKDPAKTIKKQEKCNEWIRTLTKKCNLERVYKDIEDSILNLIINKCEGNVLISLQFFFNLINNGFVEVDRNNVVVAKPKLQQAMRLQNFSSIPVPSKAHKKRLMNIDQFLKKGRSVGNNLRKQEMTVKGLMMMKTASIIGEEFGTAALKTILPLRHETHGSILATLKELEQQELIEILDETDPKNIRCRFNRCFLRESIYQVMLYKGQKKVLHQQLAEYLQSLPTPKMDLHQIEIEIERIRDHLLIAEDVQSDKDLPFKQKYGIIIKQMQSLLLGGNPKTVLYKGTVLKQGKKGKKTISTRLLILTCKELQWFHNGKEYEKNYPPLGCIKLADIYNCKETDLAMNTFAFQIAIDGYERKGMFDNAPRLIKFGCEKESDRHEWIARIEFMKAKNVYENYINKFVNIQFPLRQEEDVEEEDIEQKRDAIYEKLHQFGKHFKQSAKINHQTIERAATQHNSKLRNQNTLSSVRNQIRNRRSRQSFISSQGLRQSSYESGYNEYQMQQQQSAQQAKDLAKKIGKLYNTSIICTVNHMTTNSNKHQMHSRGKQIGILPNYFDPEWVVTESPLSKSAQSAGTQSKTSQLRSVERESENNIILRSGDRNPRGSHNKVSRSKERRDTRKSVMTPTPNDCQQIEEQTEGSQSSGNHTNPHAKQQSHHYTRHTSQINHQGEVVRIKGQKGRISENLTTERAKDMRRELVSNLAVGTNNETKEHIQSSQEKTSGNSVTQQLKLIEEKKQIEPSSFIMPNNIERKLTFQKITPRQGSPEKEQILPKVMIGRGFVQKAESSGHASSIKQHISQRSQQSDRNLSNQAFEENLGHLNGGNFNPNRRHVFRQNELNSGVPPLPIGHIVNQTASPVQPRFFNGQSPIHPRHEHSFDMSLNPMIQKEISKQINLSLSHIFMNLDKKIEEEQKLNESPAMGNRQPSQTSLAPNLLNSRSLQQLQTLLPQFQEHGEQPHQMHNRMDSQFSSTPLRAAPRGEHQQSQKTTSKKPFSYQQLQQSSRGVQSKNRQIIDSNVPQSKQSSAFADDDDEPLDPMAEPNVGP